MITIPDELRKYMDISDRQPKIINSAPKSIKETAHKINEKYLELTGKKYFSNI